MGKIGYGYGSEWHLLRYLGYHRGYLSSEILKITDGNSITWLDFNFSTTNKPLEDDKELLGLEFIEDPNVQEKWKSFWPQTGKPQNWDAVGKIHYNNCDEWLLVEAKGHINELKSKGCRAKPQSKQIIKSSLQKTSQVFGNKSKPVENWLESYYQYANRLAVLYFLMQECKSVILNARLLFIYFYGENRENEKLKCPKSEKEWLQEIKNMNEHLGVDKSCELFKRVYYLFLPVNPDGKGVRVHACGYCGLR